MTYNSAYTGPQIDAAARLASIIFDDLPAMLADARDYTAHTAGDVFWTATEGFRYRVAASDASDHHLTTAGGVKLYVLPGDDGVYNFGAFNPAADDTTDDYAKLMLAINAYKLDGGRKWSGPTVIIPDGEYYIGQTVDLKSVVQLIGNNSGMYERRFPRLRFPANTTGIIVHRWNTADETLAGGNGGDDGHADGSTIRGLYIKGGGSSGADKAKHGIWLRGSARIEQCWIEEFPGNGVNIVADVGSNPALGVANLFYLDRVWTNFNGRSGVYAEGGDVNAGVGICVDASYNARWGVEDRSFLGNTWIACHTSANGFRNDLGNGVSVARYAGAVWSAHPEASEAAYVATEPGTNDSVWVWVSADTLAPEFTVWEAGLPQGTYRAGGSYCAFGDTNQTVFYNCYAEIVQGAVYVGQSAMYHNGIGGNGVIGPGVHVAVAGGQYRARNFVSLLQNTAGANLEVKLGGSGSAGSIIEHEIAGKSDRWALRYSQGTGDIFYGGGGFADNKVAAIFTATDTNEAFGRGTGQPWRVRFPLLGFGSFSDARTHDSRAAAPTTGTWARGDVVWNNTPSAAGWAGWICVTAGTPGTWKRFGAIEA